VITQQATEALRLQLRPQCKLQKSCGRAQEPVIHRIPAHKGAECELDVACSQRAKDGSRCRDVLRERPNSHASKDGQDRGVVPRSVDRSASVRRCESTASKSDSTWPIRPLCKQHGGECERSDGRANSKAKGSCSQGNSRGLLEPYGKTPAGRCATVGHGLLPTRWPAGAQTSPVVALRLPPANCFDPWDRVPGTATAGDPS
jgi:hypothetical protein